MADSNPNSPIRRSESLPCISVKPGKAPAGYPNVLHKVCLKQIGELLPPLPPPSGSTGQLVRRPIPSPTVLLGQVPVPPHRDLGGSQAIPAVPAPADLNQRAATIMEMLATADRRIHAGVQRFPAFGGTNPHEDAMLQVSIASIWTEFLVGQVDKNNEDQKQAVEKILEALEKLKEEIPGVMRDLNRYTFYCEQEGSAVDVMAALLVEANMNESMLKALVDDNADLKAKVEVLKDDAAAKDKVVEDLRNSVTELVEMVKEKDATIGSLKKYFEAIEVPFAEIKRVLAPSSC